MSTWHFHPYRTPGEITQVVDRLHRDVSPLVQPQRILEDLRRERSAVGRFNGWLADHIVGLAGTMAFFYFLCLVIGGWGFWQSDILGNRGFDPYPYSFLFFILGGIMQSLFVPTMLTATNRAALRDRIKDEADHRAWTHLYEVNDEQLKILRELATRLLQHEADEGAPGGSVSRPGVP
ncbi:MAG: DUF1003 domain-containing protein [Bacteroidetes bacterium]|nr:DUF1003 domain-containing protein [Bacteroidota bacterium]